VEAKRDQQPSLVLFGAKQDGQADRASLSDGGSVQPAVWTLRMLQALEQGVKGGIWFSLMDKVYAMRNLEAASQKVVANKGSAGVDHVTVQMFEANRDTNLRRLHEQLRDGSYEPQAMRRVYIPKPGSRERRPLGVPTVRDRTVQTALRNVIEPIFERDFAEHSYGFRPGRGCRDALRRVDALLRQGYLWVIDVDIKAYFDTIPHEPLLELIRKKIADGRVLALIESLLGQRVLESAREWTPRDGTPQGAVISPLLANVYLDSLDHLMAAQGFEMTRYADDMVIQCRDGQEAERALAVLSRWTREAKLTLHPEKTRIVQVTERQGFDFLGYHMRLSRHKAGKVNRWPRRKSERRFKDAVRALTKRNNGRSLECTIAKLNPVIRGFFNYFKHSIAAPLVNLDKWIRGRLRSILRRRQKRQGRARGRDHQRWHNAFFHEHGLLSMAGARERLLQPSPR
jgi:RNA-directed DNA polymerase